jgi:hypothetical protein
MMAQEHLAAANVSHHPKAAAGPRSAPRRRDCHPASTTLPNFLRLLNA